MSHRSDVHPTRHVAGLPYAEGPSFDRDGRLYVCVRRDGYVVRVDTSGWITRFLTTGHQPNGTRLHRDGRLFVAEIKLKQILEVQPDGRYRVFVDRCGDTPFGGPNDLVFDRTGVLYFTDPGGSSAANPIGAVYRAWPDRRVERIAHGLAYPNGIALSADERTLFVAETQTSRVVRIELRPDGAVGAPELFATLPGGPGPDGMAFDVDGNLYVANHGGGTIDVLDRVGTLTARLSAGGKNPTNCAFWQGALYVTEDDTASVQRLDLGVEGQPLFDQSR